MIIDITKLARLLCIQNTANPDMLEPDQLWGICDRAKYITQAHEIVSWLNMHRDQGYGLYVGN